MNILQIHNSGTAVSVECKWKSTWIFCILLWSWFLVEFKETMLCCRHSAGCWEAVLKGYGSFAKRDTFLHWSTREGNKLTGDLQVLLEWFQQAVCTVDILICHSWGSTGVTHNIYGGCFMLWSHKAWGDLSIIKFCYFQQCLFYPHISKSYLWRRQVSAHAFILFKLFLGWPCVSKVLCSPD